MKLQRRAARCAGGTKESAMEAKSGRRLGLAGIGIALAVIAGGAAYATIPSNGVISGCYTKSGGTLRVIDPSTGSCSSKETSVNWNVQGAAGPQGPAGPAGAQGVQGIQGLKGDPGTNGADGAAGPAGAAGASDVYLAKNDGNPIVPVGITFQEVLGLTLADAGNYALTAKGTWEDNAAASDGGCRLVWSGNLLDEIDINAAQNTPTPSPSSARLRCPPTAASALLASLSTRWSSTGRRSWRRKSPRSTDHVGRPSAADAPSLPPFWAPRPRRFVSGVPPGPEFARQQ
jgi:hypothetical protein